MLWKQVHLLGLMMVLLVSGCATYRTIAVRPDPRPLGKGYETIAASQTAEADSTTYVQKTPIDILTLPQALSLALLNNSELAVFSYEIRAAETRALQAGLYPNPEFEIELENFAGSGGARGFAGSEITIALSHSILLTGKRYKHTRVAVLEGDLAAWDYESNRLDVFTEVRRAFTKVLAAQQRVTLNEELVKLSEQPVKSIAERVKAGKVSPAELSRAQVSLSATRVELERARRELQAARAQLAATWGSPAAEFTQAVGLLDTLFAIPTLEKLGGRLVQNPDLARFTTELEQRQATIDLEDAQRVPDLTISGGLKRLNESDDNALVVGLSIPLPLSDSNQGARQEARFQLVKTLRERQAVEVRLNAALSQAYNDVQSALNEASILKDQILPQAQNAYNVINAGYLMGRFDFLDVLDAQRTLFEARAQYLRAVAEFHTVVPEIERLIAQEIHTVQQ